LILCFLFSAAAVFGSDNVSLQGLIVGEQDDDGNTVAVFLQVTQSSDEDKENTVKYRIENNPKGKALYGFLDQNVKVTGTTRTDKNGSAFVSVLSYEILVDENRTIIDEIEDEEMDEIEEIEFD
jgi:hypothetical protein